MYSRTSDRFRRTAAPIDVVRRGHVLPRVRRMPRPEFVRQTARRLRNDLKAARHGIHGVGVRVGPERVVVPRLARDKTSRPARGRAAVALPGRDGSLSPRAIVVMVRAECAADEKAPGISIGRVPVITVGVVGCGRVIPPTRKWNTNADNNPCLGRRRRQGQRAKTQHGNQDHSEMLEPRVPCENGHGLPPHLPRPRRSLILLIRGSPYFYPQRG